MENTVYTEHWPHSLLKEYSTMMRKLSGFRFQPVRDLCENRTVAWQVHPSFATSVHRYFFKTMAPSLICSYIMWVIDVLGQKQGFYWLPFPHQIIRQDAIFALFLQRAVPDNIILWFSLPSPGDGLPLRGTDKIARLRHRGWKTGVEAPPGQFEEAVSASENLFDYIRMDYSDDISAPDFLTRLPAAKDHAAGIVVGKLDTALKLKYSQDANIQYGLGTLWPDRHFSITTPYEVSQQATHYHNWVSE